MYVYVPTYHRSVLAETKQRLDRLAEAFLCQICVLSRVDQVCML